MIGLLGNATTQRMTRYLLRVYSDAGYYPDKALHSHSRGRAERHAKQLEREGFRTTLLVAPSPLQLGGSKVPVDSSFSTQSKGNPAIAS